MAKPYARWCHLQIIGFRSPKVRVSVSTLNKPRASFWVIELDCSLSWTHIQLFSNFAQPGNVSNKCSLFFGSAIVKILCTSRGMLQHIVFASTLMSCGRSQGGHADEDGYEQRPSPVEEPNSNRSEQIEHWPLDGLRNHVNLYPMPHIEMEVRDPRVRAHCIWLLRFYPQTGVFGWKSTG